MGQPGARDLGGEGVTSANVFWTQKRKQDPGSVTMGGMDESYREHCKEVSGISGQLLAMSQACFDSLFPLSHFYSKLPGWAVLEGMSL